MKAQDQTLFYHYNPRGDVVAMTDQNGQVVANYEYDAWGNVLKSDTKGITVDNPFGYAGYMYDKEIVMYGDRAIEGIETVHELLIVVFFIVIENDNL